MIYDASDPEHIAKALAYQEDAGKDLDSIVAHPRGRRWCYNLMFTAGHLMSPSFVPGSFDSTAFNEGARSVGNQLHEQLRSQHSAAYMKMLEENHFDEPK
jgi:hypothetical protein|tara:strand:+ start:3502 stop:3801 length:300 start_codon:yes stop_codon:yes gene_type:complete